MKTDKPRRSDPLTVAEIAEIQTTLQSYEEELKEAPGRLSIKGKSFAEAQKEQATWPFYYAGRKARLSVLHKQMETRCDAIRGRLHRRYKENDALSSSERQIDKYVDADEDFLAAVELKLYVDEVYKQYIEVIESGFDKRGFALRDLTEARSKDFQNEVI